MSERLSVGIVGPGIMGRTHAVALAAYHRSAVSGWVGRGERSLLAAQAIIDAPVFGALGDLLADPGTDAVLVATPDHLHREPAVAAAEAGKHVLIEKPLATSVADARAIRAAAEANGVVAMTLFNHRFVPSYWQAKQQIDERNLGALTLAYARKNDVRSVPLEMIGWAAETTPAWFLSAHDLDLLIWYAGEAVESVYASAVTGTLQALGVDTPDAVQAQVRFAGGAVATVEACWSYPNTFPTMTDSFMELILHNGVIHLDRKQEQIEVADQERHSYPRNLLVNHIAGKPAGSTVAAVEHFVDCVLDDHDPLIDIASSVHVTEVLAAIHESCQSGQPVQLKESSQ